MLVLDYLYPVTHVHQYFTEATRLRYGLVSALDVRLLMGSRTRSILPLLLAVIV